MMYPELHINGMTTESDVIEMIKDNIDRGDLDDAKDYLGQFKDYLIKKEEATTDMDKAAEKTSQGSFFDWFTSDSNDKNESNQSHMQLVKAEIEDNTTKGECTDDESGNAKEADNVVTETISSLKKFWKAEYATNNTEV